ncbi:FeoB-associated Cys-rich membrane protein [Neisseria weixii]
MIQNILVGIIVLGCVVYVLKHFFFKPKAQSSGCGRGCEGCSGKSNGCHH